MASLHIINSPITPHKLEQLTALIAKDDGILITQDACYSLKNTTVVEQLNRFNCFVLEDDAKARNISSPLQHIDYSKFVELTLQYRNSITW